MMLKKWRSLIIEEFFRSPIQFIRRVCFPIYRFLTIFHHRFKKATSLCSQRKLVEIQTVRSLWSSSLERQKLKAFTWTWGLRRGKFSETTRWTITSSEWNQIHDLNFFNLFWVQTFRLIEAVAETYGGFPFEFENLFKIALGFDSKVVRISVNGKFFCEYPHKARLSSISGLKIREKNNLSLHIQELHHYKVSENLHNLDSFSRLP